MIYIVNVSGGLTSYEALRRTIARYGHDATRAVFADTKIEDAGLYTFLDDIERHLSVPIVRLADGRTPFDVWIDARAITLPNSAAPCSKELKRDVIDRWLADIDEPYTLVFGMDWSEPDRMARLEARYAADGIPVWFPLSEPPYLDKCHIADALERDGITVPALYIEGFTHNNCGGGCVKAGQAHWAHLWRTRPATYALWEAKEAAFMAHIGKKRTILVDRRGGGPRRPVTLAEFRDRLERGESYDADEWGGCGCFAPVAQERMDLLMEVKPRER